MLHDSWGMTIHSDTSNLSDITLICELITELVLINDFDLTESDLFLFLLLPNMRRFPLNNATGAASKQRTLTPLDTLSRLRLAFVLMMRPFSPELVMFSDSEFRTSFGTSILHRYVRNSFLILEIKKLSIKKWIFNFQFIFNTKKWIFTHGHQIIGRTHLFGAVLFRAQTRIYKRCASAAEEIKDTHIEWSFQNQL